MTLERAGREKICFYSLRHRAFVLAPSPPWHVPVEYLIQFHELYP